MKKFLLGLALLAASTTVTSAQSSPVEIAVLNTCARLENLLTQGKITKETYRVEASALKQTIKNGGHEAAIKAVETKFFGGQPAAKELKGTELQVAQQAVSVVIGRMEALVKTGKLSPEGFATEVAALKAAAINGTHTAAINSVESRLFSK